MQTEGANLDGIVAKNGALVVAESSTGKLFRVDPATGVAEEIDLAGVAGAVSTAGAEGHRLNRGRNSNLGRCRTGRSQLAAGPCSAISLVSWRLRRQRLWPQGDVGSQPPVQCSAVTQYGVSHRRAATPSRERLSSAGCKTPSAPHQIDSDV